MSNQQFSDSKRAPDGRHLRSERSRALIARSMLELVRETLQIPTTDAVAERAAVSRRSVFRHYADVSELLKAAYELERQQTVELFPRQDMLALSQAERINGFVDRTVDLYEYISPVRQAAVHMARDYPVLLDLMREDDSLHRDLILELFAEYLAGKSRAEIDVFVSGLAAASAWGTWNSLRRCQSLPVDSAKATMRGLMRGLLLLAQSNQAVLEPAS